MFDQTFGFVVGNYTAEAQGLGGWSISDHHVYDRRLGELTFLGLEKTIPMGEYSVIDLAGACDGWVYDRMSGNHLGIPTPISLNRLASTWISTVRSWLVAHPPIPLSKSTGRAKHIVMRGQSWAWFDFDCPCDAIDQPSRTLSTPVPH